MSNNDNSRLRIAIQKSGRLSEESQNLLKGCGLKINLADRRLLSHVANMPIDLMLVRSSDIPGLVMDGICDLGIVGDNTLEEHELERVLIGEQADYKKTLSLNFGSCRLSTLNKLVDKGYLERIRRPGPYIPNESILFRKLEQIENEGVG